MTAKGRLGSQVVNSLQRQAQLLNATIDQDYRIDLTQVTEINAVGLLGLTLLIRYLGNHDCHIIVLLPVAEEPRKIIETQIPPHVKDVSHGWTKLLTVPGVTFVSRTRSQHLGNQPSSYVGLFHLLTLDDGLSLMPFIWDHLANNLKFEQDECARFCISFSELCQNIHHHSLSTFGGFVAFELQWSPTAHPKVILALGDIGIGIRASFEQAGAQVGSDVDAIRRAVKAGRSSKGDENSGRGGGLARCRSHAHDKSYAFGIRTGRGYWYLFNGRENDTHESWFPGTQVYFALGKV